MNWNKVCPIIIIFFLIFCVTPLKSQEDKAKKRESIFDGVVHIETDLITQVPSIPRWCNRLELKKDKINAGDAQLYVEEEGKGIPLILINGGPGGTHHCFHPWFSQIKDIARIIYYDQRGCGLSDFSPGKDGYNVQQAIADLDAIRKAKKIEKWVILGYSYGGFLAQYYTATYPEHVAGLVLLGASPAGEDDTDSRQGMFISKQEQEKQKEISKQVSNFRKEKGISRKEAIQILIYNNMINGDWKRQHYYKPSLERMAQIALYEWDNDVNFNGIMNDSLSSVDLTGAFDLNPIPTLILEGKWDLTWTEEKPGIMKKSHPNAKMVIFEKAGHTIFNEDTEHFFKVVSEFLQNLPTVPEKKIKAYKSYLINWNQEIQKKLKESPEYFLKTVGWGLKSSKKIVDAFSWEWLDKLTQRGSYLHLGFAFYDCAKYQEALKVYEKMQSFAEKNEDKIGTALSLIWQGHMLDLMGKRDSAITRYKKVEPMNITASYTHLQYNLDYQLSPYASERIKTPFKRIENNSTN